MTQIPTTPVTAAPIVHDDEVEAFHSLPPLFDQAALDQVQDAHRPDTVGGAGSLTRGQVES